MKKSLAAILTVVGLVGFPMIAMSAVPRTFVSVSGNDANTISNCTAYDPCRTIRAALTVTQPDGEVVIATSAAYGTFEATNSVTISAAPGVYAGVQGTASVEQAILVDGPGISVTLRGLTVNGAGSNAGVVVRSQGSKLIVEDCTISGHFGPQDQGMGIGVLAQDVELQVTNSTIRNNAMGIYIATSGTIVVSKSVISGNKSRQLNNGYGGGGILANSGYVGWTTTLHVVDSLVTGNYVGIQSLNNAVGSTSRAFISGTTISNNTTGVISRGIQRAYPTDPITRNSTFLSGNRVTGNVTGILTTTAATTVSYRNNFVDGNTVDVSGPLIARDPQ